VALSANGHLRARYLEGEADNERQTYRRDAVHYLHRRAVERYARKYTEEGNITNE